MRGDLTRLRTGRAVTWRTVFGLVLVPLVVAGVFIWGLWSPTERLDTVTAAVVNLDEPVTVDGQLVPLGRVLAAELIDGGADTNFTWLLTDESDAAAGLDDGRYATVITIPKNFSSAATSFSRAAAESAEGSAAEAAQRATIEVQTSDRGRLLDSALSNIVTATATSVLNAQLGAQFVGGVLVGMTELGEGIGDAADGAEQLADGSAQLADGVQQLASGTAELSAGAQSLGRGASELATGARKAADGGAELASGIEDYVGGVNTVLVQVQALAPELVTQLESLYTAIDNDSVPLPPGADKQETLDQLRGAINGMGGLGAQLDPLIDGGNKLAAGSRASAKGQAQLAGGLEQFSAGMNQFAAGAPSLAAGASQLADGARLSADGTTELAEGLRSAVDQIPNYTESKAQDLAEVAVQPIDAEGASGELFSAAGVPLFAGIALWAGALSAFLVLAPLWRRTKEAARGVGYIALRSALPAFAIGAVQGTLAGLLLPALLGYDFAQGIGFFGLAVLAGVTFALVNQGLSALLGGFGRFVSFALLVVAFAIGVISTAPPLLQAIGDASPIGALFSGFQAIAMGASGAGAAAFTLVIWGLGGLALTAFAVSRVRRRAILLPAT